MALRPSSAPARLVRLGFIESERAERLLRDPQILALGVTESGSADALTDALAETADPDLALVTLVRLLEAAEADPEADVSGLRAALCGDPISRDRLVGLLGASSALGDHLVTHPRHWRAVVDARWLSTRERIEALVAAVTGRDPATADPTPDDALRVAYRQQMVGIVALDVTAPDPVALLPTVAAALADLAQAALEAATTLAIAEIGDADQYRFAVIGMGKSGGRELNYVSDVDVIFVAEPAEGADEESALATATKVASRMMQACSASTPAGSLWPVDAALRPEGKQGPLVRTVASHRHYYERWAKTWEFQALLKARPMAGDADLGRAYLQAVQPMVWEAASREHFVEDVQAMRRRVEEHVPSAEAKRQLKLGPGGLRDVEFSVQLLQLVHGRSDETLRSRTTLEALTALAAGGYVGRDDAAVLDKAYRLLRTLEHRIQLHRMRRTHLMPTATGDLRRLGRALGYRADPATEVARRRESEAREVRQIHEKLFYRPLLASVARLTPGEARLSPEAARSRLAALGFADPAGAMRHLEALTSGLSRTAAIQRQILPVLLGWFAEEAAPDDGLLAFRQVSDALGSTPWYLKMLRDEGRAAEILSRSLAQSWLVSNLLVATPTAAQILGEPHGLEPKPRAQILQRMRAAATRKEDPDEAIAAARGTRRRELFRIGVADLQDGLGLARVGEALTDVAAALVQTGLEVATRAAETRLGEPLGIDLLVVGMGRFGGGELGYSSDLDVLFVHRAHAGVDEATAQARATEVITELRRLLGTPGADPPVGLDADLRPEGKAGPITRSLESYRTYYERWSATWEAQALLRATPVAGDEQLAADFLELIDPVRWPADGIDETQLREVRRLKARMEAERMPRGADRKTHFKLGQGGLSDVEWTIQLLQLQHAHEIPGLRTTSTLGALQAATATGLVTSDDAQALREAWELASETRNAGMLFRGRPVDSVPADVRTADAVGRIVGLPAGSGQELANLYRRKARHARQVVDRLFYGDVERN
ncbi:bifunctional [glutamine synthetase] adenylyltransferase/[glutamine synthetase]-adenylyl-L-tyrosine phosphorylase [Kribbia dieselivorans]|uniref:bifunctional [glutamine synthetase] adenylyltransferase/[glutamine synthetase]-adenylyl-L-tyrosine phosphorylase n=1 Tax=Kribbia dieselivorans TaxID=331526 RepID=UPI000837E905|nr:bifunctional [glutamine synthetase] adenylyltransferase/[glutamine synthetase]-adenylyl-L-tyrosine phosphorylase [Kribbia dieselivorans]